MIIVGTGIKAGLHLTAEARDAMVQVDDVLYLVADPVTESLITQIAPRAESLAGLYRTGTPRIETYDAIVEQVMARLRNNRRVCVAFYGHPCVFVYPSREMAKRARLENFAVEFQPGISAEDCLFADLNLDPARSGCQSFEATDFLVHRRIFDPRSALILWQIGIVGDMSFDPNLSRAKHGIKVLANQLSKTYTGEHEVVVYEASQYAVCDPRIDRVALKLLPDLPLTGISTLYVPPKEPSIPDNDIMKELNLRLRGNVVEHA